MRNNVGVSVALRYSLLALIALVVFNVFFFGVPLSSTVAVQKELLVDSVARDSSSKRRPPLRNTPSKATTQEGHRVAGLSCKAFSGPTDEQAAEMVYWRDVPSDAAYVPPFYEPGTVKYLTFEPDEGGFNNIRMAMETAVAMAISMGRTLVLPPEQKLYLLDRGEKKFSFKDFYHVESIHDEHKAAGGGLEIISFEEFLKREAMTGKLVDNESGRVSFPPENRTNWGELLGFNYESVRAGHGKRLWTWLRQVVTTLEWSDRKCLALFPSGPRANSTQQLEDMFAQIHEADKKQHMKRINSFTHHPTPVNGSSYDRMREIVANRMEACPYNETLQSKRIVHIRGNEDSGTRLLVHFYAFLFYEDWKQDLWMKRFVRDHLRYVDEIQCAAARLVNAMREISRKRGNEDGVFDTFHIRRGDFQYHDTKIPAEAIWRNNTRLWTKEKRVIYVATDERDFSFFKPLEQHYSLYFLNDFDHLLKDVDPNFYGMIDQLVAARGETFSGIYYSTFTGYINRIRGYHSQKRGVRDGVLESYNIAPDKNAYQRRIYRQYESVAQPFWAREFPVAWRDIDSNVHPLD